MKFLADMGISPRVVEELREREHDAIHLVEEGLNRLPDGETSKKPVGKTESCLPTIWISVNCLPRAAENYQVLLYFA